MSPSPFEDITRGIEALRERLAASAGADPVDWLSEQLGGRPEPERPLDEIQADLDGLVELGTVKDQVRALTAFLQVQARRAEHGLPETATSQHLVFLGNPGTGKTTVARLLAEMYRSIGLLKRGHLVEVDRAGLVGGYPALMHRFLNSNPGLRSRFSREITFPDYSTDDLLAIAERFAQQDEYVLDAAALAELRRILEGVERRQGFGNARYARTLFEQALNAQALRLAGADARPLGELGPEELTRIEAADVAAPARAPGDRAEPVPSRRWRRRRD